MPDPSDLPTLEVQAFILGTGEHWHQWLSQSSQCPYLDNYTFPANPVLLQHQGDLE